MRKSLIMGLLLLPFLLASSLRIAAAMSDAGSSSPWNNPVATASESIDADNGVTVENLSTIAPPFDSLPPDAVADLKLANWKLQGVDRAAPPPLFILNRTLRI